MHWFHSLLYVEHNGGLQGVCFYPSFCDQSYVAWETLEKKDCN